MNVALFAEKDVSIGINDEPNASVWQVKSSVDVM